MPEFTKDNFLGGGIRIWQPKKGYRAGIDPILLAASVNASEGQKVLDLGCGVGTASFAIGYRVKNVEQPRSKIFCPSLTFTDAANSIGSIPAL